MPVPAASTSSSEVLQDMTLVISNTPTSQPEALPWDYCVPMDGVSIKVREHLAGKLPLTEGMRGCLLQAIYDDVTTRYQKL